jgi:hypothetical protein
LGSSQRSDGVLPLAPLQWAWGDHLAIKDLSDGTSSTSMMAEIAISHWEKDTTAQTYNPKTAVLFPPNGPGAVWLSPNNEAAMDQMRAACLSADASQSVRGWESRLKGWGSYYEGDAYAWRYYNHLLGPNKPWCANQGDVNWGTRPAGSWHPGGANHLMSDGTVRFIGDNVDTRIYRAIGTRQGGESIDNTQF